MMPQYKYILYWLNLLNYSFPDVLACCIIPTINKTELSLRCMESIVVVLLLSPSRASLIESVYNGAT